MDVERASLIRPVEFPDDLSLLDANRDRAAALYVELHTLVRKLFAWKSCADPDALADEVMRRGLRRIREGVSVETSYRQYFSGIANWIVREEQRALRNRTVPLDRTSLVDVAPYLNLDDRIRVHQALAAVSADDRQVLIEYFSGDRGDLARRLGTTSGALRVRIHRLLTTIRDRSDAGRSARETKTARRNTER